MESKPGLRQHFAEEAPQEMIEGQRLFFTIIQYPIPKHRIAIAKSKCDAFLFIGIDLIER